MSFPVLWVVWLAAVSGPSVETVPLYTNADLLRFGPAPEAPAGLTAGSAADREAWVNVQRFIDRQYRRIDAERGHALARRRADAPREPATVYVQPPWYGRYRPIYPILPPTPRPQPDPGPPKAGSDHARFPHASDRPLRQVVPVREQISRGRGQGGGRK